MKKGKDSAAPELGKLIESAIAESVKNHSDPVTIRLVDGEKMGVGACPDCGTQLRKRNVDRGGEVILVIICDNCKSLCGVLWKIDEKTVGGFTCKPLKYKKATFINPV